MWYSRKYTTSNVAIVVEMAVNIVHTHMKMSHLPKEKNSLPKEGKIKF